MKAKRYIRFISGIMVLCSIFLLITSACEAPWRTAMLEAVLYDVDLLKVDDGVYIGQHEYRNYMYRVQVEVSDNRITEIEIIDWEPNDARIKAPEIFDRVIEHQSLCFDAITGATTASKLYLLCLEDAFPYHKSEKCSD
jgi:uncharacterized protein with FMN-binding domain